MAELVGSAASFSYDGLIGGTKPAVFTVNETLLTGTGVYQKGQVLGKITASGKLKTVNSANSDGSQTAYAVLLTDNVDTAAADVVVTVAKSGVFNREKLTFGGTDTAAKHEDTLRDLNIYLTSTKGVESI